MDNLGAFFRKHKYVVIDDFLPVSECRELLHQVDRCKNAIDLIKVNQTKKNLKRCQPRRHKRHQESEPQARGSFFAKRTHFGLRSLRPVAGNRPNSGRSDRIRPLKCLRNEAIQRWRDELHESPYV